MNEITRPWDEWDRDAREYPENGSRRRAPLQVPWQPCLFRVHRIYDDRKPPPVDYYLSTPADLYRMSLWYMDSLVVRCRWPHIPEDYVEWLPEMGDDEGNDLAVLGLFCEDEEGEDIARREFRVFMRVVGSRNGAYAWWWLQAHHYGTTGDEAVSLEPLMVGYPRTWLPVPTEPPVSPITWITDIVPTDDGNGSR